MLSENTRHPPWTLRRRLLAVYAVIVVVVLVGAGGSLLALRNATRRTGIIESRLGPAQVAVARLSQTYRDLDTNLRTLRSSTGQAAALAPVVAARGRAEGLDADIHQLLASEATLTAGLVAVDDAAEAWLSTVVDPAIARARSSPGTVDATLPGDANAQLFVAVRASIDGFTDAVAAREASEQRSAHRDEVTVAATLVAGTLLSFLTGVLLFLVLHYSITRPLDGLVERIGAVAGGNLEAAVPAVGAPELASVGRAAERMRQRLLDDAAGKVNSALIAGQEMERRRIAGQIHDDQVQAMTAASLRLQQLRRRLGDADEQIRGPLAAAEEATNQATARLRRMIFELYSPVLESEGLLAALEVYLDETFTDGVTWYLAGNATDIPPAIAALAYRLARESLWNIVKHAHATRVDVVADLDDTWVVLTITDDGVGFDATSPPRTTVGHLGIDYSRDLAEAAGGRWTIHSEPGTGTTVHIRLPISGGSGVHSA